MTLLRPSLAGLRPYMPGEQPPDGEAWVKLNTNESPWAPSPRVLEAIRAAVGDDLRLYPEPTSAAVRRAAGNAWAVDPEQIVVGNGGDEILRLAFTAFAEPGAPVAWPWPTYSLLPVLASQGCQVAEPHPWPPGEPLPESLFASRARLLVLTNPNSPTGAWVEPAVVSRLCAAASGVVLVDEAYVDFAEGGGCLGLLDRHPNLLVVRTLSKSAGLAGMRIGFGIGAAEVVEGLRRVVDSYPLDRLAAVAAVAALEDSEHRDHLVARVRSERARLGAELRQLGFTGPPSAANFVLVRPPVGHEAGDLQRELHRRRVLVRHFPGEAVGEWLRISVGRPDETDALLTALGDIGLRSPGPASMGR